MSEIISLMNSDAVKAAIRTIRGFPKPDINFRDLTTLFEQPVLFKWVVDELCGWAQERGYEALAGIDARGFIIGGAMATQLSLPMVLVRKKGKLPHDTHSVDYTLEYGTATLEVHKSDKLEGRRTLIIDDLLATGGTALATAQLLRKLNATSLGFAAIVNLCELPGARLLKEAGIEQKLICDYTEDE